MASKKFEILVPTICTRGAIVFPNQEIVIDVLRRESIEAIYESEAEYDNYVFLVSQKNITIQDVYIDNMYKFGTFAQIIGVMKRPDGTIKLSLVGLERATLLNSYVEKNMIFSNIRWIKDVSSDPIQESILIKRVVKEFKENSKLLRLPNDLITDLQKGITAPELCDRFAQYYYSEVEKKQAFLECIDINDRLMKIIEAVEDAKLYRKVESEIEEKVRERMENNQKEYYLREKIKAIKEELGESYDDTDGLEDITKMVKENPYPENIREKILDEIKRLQMLPPGSAESGIIRNYIDWLVKTPWYQESKDNQDLNRAANILDEDHYGLKKVKERILEYLAVKQMTKSLSSPIICLVGPPGVGKTSLAKSISRSLDRKFVKVSLGGVKDESEIRGHRRTYLGALPGRLIQGMKKAQVINPVFLIDEIDKMASDFKGDPSSAMLEVLDPEQNRFFSDHYLEECYDLSKVMFIATANYLEDIPPALRDRLEIIQLSSYTELEKTNIANNYLVKKQMKLTGLKASQFKIDQDMIIYLIRHYTREAGVRQLERIIASLTRKTVLQILKENKKSVKITKKLVNEWLGKEMFEYGARETKDQVGVVTGLAYTSFGGDILPVEVTYFEGKGKLVVTGQLGDVMTESTEIALDYIKSNAKKLKIDSKFFENHDIHIHVPEGAVPKDGPSAGITLTTAIISAITKQKVKCTLAMTGEVTLRGNVLPIGGLKEKSLAASRSGIKTILFPKANLKDLDEVPETVKESIDFIPVETMNDVLQRVFI